MAKKCWENIEKRWKNNEGHWATLGKIKGEKKKYDPKQIIEIDNEMLQGKWKKVARE
jgi:hypothetical protein